METQIPDLELLHKYNVPTPRYTSYPTVPFWHQNFGSENWDARWKETFARTNQKEGISLYIHLPFCESLCTYCGCNKKITTNHKVEEEYLNAIFHEWTFYREQMESTPCIKELHLGGGTPTFFSPENLRRLMQHLLQKAQISPDPHFSFEGHPNNTTREHLQALFDEGFRRVSFGVQDNDPEVQRIINRIQPFQTLSQAVESARTIGYESVNFDLIYGLPLQTPESISRTIAQCLQLRPDRIAFYSYAHVPWTSAGQRLFDERDLPSAAQKMNLYVTGKKAFQEAGYQDIGMDHFALPGEALYRAWKAGTLHRNFMGYTTQPTELLIGLGVSSISDCGTAFAQNKKSLHDYYEQVQGGGWALEKGYLLTEEDRSFRKYILDIACKGYTQFQTQDLEKLRVVSFPELQQLQSDGLVSWNEAGMEVTSLGRHFIRNICRAFDLHLLGQEKNSVFKKFSQAI